jgi:CheY-like chemotaxis protein
MLPRIGAQLFPPQKPDFRVLYVGQDQNWLAALRKVIRRPEFHIVSCPDHSSAIRFLKGDPKYHLLIFDLEPQEPTALELIGLARSLPHREHLPIVIVAGELTDQSEDLARQTGANECLTKTKDTSVAGEIIKRLIL